MTLSVKYRFLRFYIFITPKHISHEHGAGELICVLSGLITTLTLGYYACVYNANYPEIN
jgi:hypothetical protein